MFIKLIPNWFVIIALLIIGLTILYAYIRRKFNYWKSRGINGPKPIILFGTMSGMFSKSLNQMLNEEYKKYGRIYGTYFGTKPILNVNEPQLIKDIYIKDFHKFVNHNDLVTGDPMVDRNLFNAFDDDWKQLRSIISPTFTSGKMRRMHPLIEDCVKSVEKILLNAANDKKEVELKSLMGNFAMDVIATCAFATKVDAHSDTKNPFIEHAKAVTNGSLRVLLAFALFFTVPKLAKILQISMVDRNALNFFKQVIRSIIEKRKTDNNQYVDFLQLMINTQKKELSEEFEDKNEENISIFDQSSDKFQIEKSISKFKLTETDILATAFLFFVAGYETTASMISFVIYSLTIHEEYQQKLYEELKSVDKLDYDTIGRLPYLDACIAETQRCFSFTAMNRIASEDYKLGDTGITVAKGTLISTNVEGIHHDPEYYPNPECFDPERFMPENRHKLIPYTFLPFGIGPRICVGMRFALMEAKTAIAHMITKFKFVRTDNTEVPPQYKKLSFFLQPVNGIKVGVEARTSL